jgi:hypothetical protein
MCWGYFLLNQRTSTSGGVPFWLICWVVSFALGSVAMGQEKHDVPASAANRREAPEPITLRGCLGKWPNYFAFASETQEGLYALTGNTSGLEKYLDRELILEGHRTEDIEIDGYFKPFPALRVERIVKVVEKQTPNLSDSFKNRRSWLKETNRKYGVKFAHPKDMNVAAASDRQLAVNFATEEGTEVLGNFSIPATAYAKANFRGGTFSVFVDSKITARSSCLQFADLGPREEPPASYRVGRLEYAMATAGDAAMGSWASDYSFHIFKNGSCFELAFELWEYNAHIADNGCNVPLLSEEDNLNLIKPLIAGVSFFPPR